jgi:hypothetical protein
VDAAGTATVRYDEARVDEQFLAEQVRVVGFDLA